MTRFGPWLLTGLTLTHACGCVIVAAQVERKTTRKTSWFIQLRDNIKTGRESVSALPTALTTLTDKGGKRDFNRSYHGALRLRAHSSHRRRAMSTRKALSKRTRFAVFERNKFTCQYCGKIPPEVTLEIDHVVPISKGGTDEELNLTTSCRDCNAGKTNKEIGKFEPSRDPFFERCRLEQERLELEAYIEESEIHARTVQRVIGLIQDHWIAAFSAEYQPKGNIVQRWLKLYSPEIIKGGIDAAAIAYSKGTLKNPDNPGYAFNNAIRYASACMRNTVQRQMDEVAS